MVPGARPRPPIRSRKSVTADRAMHPRPSSPTVRRLPPLSHSLQQSADGDRAPRRSWLQKRVGSSSPSGHTIRSHSSGEGSARTIQRLRGDKSVAFVTIADFPTPAGVRNSERGPYGPLWATGLDQRAFACTSRTPAKTFLANRLWINIQAGPLPDRNQIIDVHCKLERGWGPDKCRSGHWLNQSFLCNFKKLFKSVEGVPLGC
jgi:hypothetical protein